MNTVPALLRWEQEGRNWPHRDASRFVSAAGMSWHVQQMGEGPALLLIHGTGASTHSWRDLMPSLSKHFHVVALDLPGHGFTQSPPRQFLSMYGMGLALKSLLHVLDVEPEIVVGHSAGAAIAVRMCIDRHIAPRMIFGVNAALMPFSGFAGQMFAPLARMLVRVPFLPQLFARRALDRKVVENIIADSGSKIDEEGIDLYAALVRSPHHVAAALGMMAEWDLPRLEKELPRLQPQLVLLTGSNDRTIPPSDAFRVRSLLPGTKIIPLERLGHLAHEERPEMLSGLIIDLARPAIEHSPAELQARH